MELRISFMGWLVGWLVSYLFTSVSYFV